MGKVRNPPPTPMMAAAKPTREPLAIRNQAEMRRPPGTRFWSKMIIGGDVEGLEFLRQAAEIGSFRPRPP